MTPVSWVGMAALAVGVGVAAHTGALAQNFPTGPVRVLVGQTAGDSTDIALRLIATPMSKVMGQPLVVENRPGATNLIAGRLVVRAKPDGYTLYFGSGPAFHPVFVKDDPIDAGKELAWIGASVSSPWYFFVRAELPVSTTKDFISYAKANPGKLNAGAASLVTIVVLQMFESRSGITTQKIPYKGAGPVAAAMLGGQVDFTASSLSTYLPGVQADKVRVLFSSRRSAVLTGLPTAAEAGFADFDIATTLGLFAPLGTPAAVVRALSAANAAAVNSPDIASELRRQDSTPVGSTPEEALREFEKEIKFWAEAARLAGVKPE